MRQLLPGRRVQPALADPAGAGERLQGLLQQVGVQGGELEPAVAGAVAVVADREVRQRPGLGLFLRQLPALGRVGGLGADHLEQPLAQRPQRRGVEHLRLVDHVRLGPASVPAGRSSYSVVNASTAAVTIAAFSASITPAAKRLAGGGGTSRPASWPGAGPGDAPRWSSSSRAPATPASTSPRVSAPTPSRSACTSSRSSSSSNRARCLRSSDQSLAFLVGRHRPGRHLRQPVQGARQRLREPHHRMRLRRRATGPAAEMRSSRS